jgi:hypothetical protein
MAKANQAMKEQRRTPWAARFRLEAAKIRQVQGQSDQVIQLLNHNWTTNSADPDITAQRLCLLSLAYARNGDSVQAAKDITEADQIQAVSPSVKAEVFAARARFELQENHLIFGG